MPGDFLLPPHLLGRACASRLGLMVSIWLPTWVESSDTISVFVFCFWWALLPLLALLRCWTLIPRLPHILGDPVYVTIFLVALPGLFPPSSTCRFFLLSTLTYMNLTNPHPLVLAGSGQNLYLYLWFFHLRLPWAACLPQKAELCSRWNSLFHTPGTAFTSPLLLLT